MALKITYKPDRGGLAEAAVSFEMMQALQGVAGVIAERANAGLSKPGYFAQSQRSTGGPRRRARAVVIAGLWEARKDDSKNHTLLRVARGAR